MKTVKIIQVLMVLIIAITGCKRESASEKGNGFLIVASFYPVYIIAMNVADGIEGVNVKNMTPPFTGCLHDYSITAGDMKNLENAGIFLINGAGMESFIDKVAGKYPGLRVAELSGGIPLIKNKEGNNPHVWVSVGNNILMVEQCAKVLSAADAKHAEYYHKNALKYMKQLKDLKNEMDTSLKKFSGRKIITFHEAFPYFADEYNFDIAAIIEREPGSEPSAKELAETVNIVKEKNIKVLFTEPQYPSGSADVISRETGAKIYILDPAVSGDDDKGAYIKIMKNNLSVLMNAFSKQ